MPAKSFALALLVEAEKNNLHTLDTLNHLCSYKRLITVSLESLQLGDEKYNMQMISPQKWDNMKLHPSLLYFYVLKLSAAKEKCPL